MKKIIILLAIFMCMLVSPSYARDFKDVNDLQIYMRKNLVYHLDSIVLDYFEYFQTPQAFEFSRMGDCDDFATYSWYNLRNMGIDAQRYILWGTDDKGELWGHAVTVFLDTDNTYSIFSNQYIVKTAELDPVEAIKDVYRTWLIIVEWHPTKYGLVTFEEFQKTIIYSASKDVKTYFQYVKYIVLG